MRGVGLMPRIRYTIPPWAIQVKSRIIGLRELWTATALRTARRPLISRTVARSSSRTPASFSASRATRTGSSPWLVKAAPETPNHGEIRIPLAVFQEGDVSFTYPDSMLSRWFSRDKPIEYYQRAYHGQVFTRSEILAIIAARGLPEEGWEPRLPDHLAPYIEAQVWNREPLLAYQEQMLLQTA